jgi:hypothetical protein
MKMTRNQFMSGLVMFFLFSMVFTGCFSVKTDVIADQQSISLDNNCMILLSGIKILRFDDQRVSWQGHNGNLVAVIPSSKHLLEWHSTQGLLPINKTLEYEFLSGRYYYLGVPSKAGGAVTGLPLIDATIGIFDSIVDTQGLVIHDVTEEVQRGRFNEFRRAEQKLGIN